MITETMQRAVVENRLSGDFVVVLGDDGLRYVAVAGILMDYSTFCTMLIWVMSGSRMYSKLMEQREGWLSRLAELNPGVMKLCDSTENMACQWLYKIMCESMVGVDRREICERFKLQTEDLPPIR